MDYSAISREIEAAQMSLEDLDDCYVVEIIEDCGYLPDDIKEITDEFNYNRIRAELSKEEKQKLISFYILSEVDGWDIV